MSTDPHELSGPPSPVPTPSEGRHASHTDMRPTTVDVTGQWDAVVPTGQRHESTADRALRIALTLRAYLGRPPGMLSDGTVDGGTGLSKLVYGINAKLDKAIEFIEAANALQAKRGKTAGELAWIVVRWAVPFVLAGAWLWLSGHVTLK